LESRAALEICGWGSKVRGSGGRSPPEAEALSEKYVLIFYQKKLQNSIELACYIPVAV